MGKEPGEHTPAASHHELLPRVAGAAAASAISALVVTPLDVVKTRMQAPPPAHEMAVSVRARAGAPVGLAASCLMHSVRREALFSPTSTAARCPTCSPMLSSLAAAVGPCDGAARGGVPSTSGREVQSLPTAFRAIVRKEGVSVLWRGLDTALVHSIPMVGIYMPLYDHLHGSLSPHAGAYAPALAGMAARAIAVAATSPLELIRTRQQASTAGGTQSWRATLLAGAGNANAGLPALRHMFTGLGATLARDVPFTALYWCSVEPIRAHLLPARDGVTVPATSHVFWANLVAGSVSGALAAAATTPFDVAKTRMQTAATLPSGGGTMQQVACLAARRLGTLDTLRTIWHTEGPAGLFAGLGPRVARAVPACAIVISTYEVVKAALQ